MNRKLFFIISFISLILSQSLHAFKIKASYGGGSFGNSLLEKKKSKRSLGSLNIFLSGLFDLSENFTSGLSTGYSYIIAYKKIEDEDILSDDYLTEYAYHRFSIEVPLIFHVPLSQTWSLRPFLNLGGNITFG